jgi:hypothetical protein
VKSLPAALLCAVSLLACDSAKPASTPAAATARQAPAGSHPVTVSRSEGALSGTVAESIDAAGYTYVRLSTAQGDTWAAIPQTALKKGQSLTLDVQMVSEGFHSKTLDRTFDRLTFATVAGAARAPAQPAAVAPPTGHLPPSPKAPANVKVARAEGKNAKTVAEVWSARAALKGSSVAVRGTVVKFLPQILGKNWVHLRDGSGSAATKDEDLTVTTQDTAKVGDVVTATGTVHTDKDYGAGYAYPVILEEAKLSR